MTLLRGAAESGGKIVILSHLNADPDAVGSSIAVAEFLKSLGAEPVMGAAGGINALARNLIKKLDYKIEVNPQISDAAAILILDSSSFSQLAPIDVASFSGDIYIVDHHIPEEDLKSRAKAAVFDEASTSTSEMVYKMLKEEGFKFTKTVSLALITGIVTDTGHLQFARPETFRIIADLLEASGEEYPEVLNFITIPTEPSRKIAHLKCASRLEMERIGEWIIALSNVSSFEASSARALVKIGADVAFVCSKEKSDVRVSIRASNKFVKKTGIHFAKDYVPQLASALSGSGGGHVAAVSINGKFEGNEEELLEKCFDLLAELVKAKAPEEAQTGLGAEAHSADTP